MDEEKKQTDRVEPEKLAECEGKAKQVSFPPRAVQIGRHWKLLMVLLALVLLLIIALILRKGML